jgi:hypothetical protein
MRNITVAISNQGYDAARVWAAEHRTSLSKTVAFILENLRDIPMASRAFPLAKPSATPPSRAATDRRTRTSNR